MLLKMNGYRWKRFLLSDQPMLENDDFPLLATFGDGGSACGAAAGYIVCKLLNEPGHHVALVLAKSRLCNLSGATIPKNELTGALIASQIKTWIQENMQIQIKRTMIFTTFSK